MLGVSIGLIGRVKHVGGGGEGRVHRSPSLMHSYCWAAKSVAHRHLPLCVFLFRNTVFAMEAESVNFAVLHPLSYWWSGPQSNRV